MTFKYESPLHLNYSLPHDFNVLSHPLLWKMSSLKILIINEKYLVPLSLAGEHPDCVGGGVGGGVHGAAGRHPPPRHPGHRGQAGQGHLDQAQDGGGRPQAEEGHQVRPGGQGEVTRAEWSVECALPRQTIISTKYNLQKCC